MGLHVGYVYVLINPAIQGFVKIGMTQGDPDKRAKRLSTTGVPAKWIVYATFHVPHCAFVERAAHRDLAKYRHSRDREFFKISPDEAVKAIQRRADENISQHPGWPNPASMQDLADKAALEQKNKADEAARLSRLEAIEREQRRQRAAEEHLQRAEQERIAAEARKQQEEARALEERRAWVDRGTRETLSEGPFGWGTIAACIFFGLIFSAVPPLMVCVVVGVGILGIWLNRHEKKDAVNLRKQWNLPAITPMPAPAAAPQPSLAQPPLAREKASTNSPEKKQEYPSWATPVAIMSLLGFFVLWSALKNRSEVYQPSHPRHEPPATPVVPAIPVISIAPANSTNATQKLLEETKRTEAHADRQIREAKHQAEIKREQQAARREAEAKRQQRARRREAERRQKAEARRQQRENQKMGTERQTEIEKNSPSLMMPNIPSNLTPRYPLNDQGTNRIRVWEHRDGVWRVKQ